MSAGNDRRMALVLGHHWSQRGLGHGRRLEGRFGRIKKGGDLGKSWTNDTRCHTWYGMKMTMHIDEALLKRVMEEYECESKTEAVEMALREMDRS